MKELLLSSTDIEQLKKYKFINGKTIRPTVDNRYEAHKLIVSKIPQLLEKELNICGFDLTNYEIRGSVGEGRMSEVFWIAFLNKNYVPKNRSGKLTTQRGMYIVLLFDRNLSKVYLAIANGAEYQKGNDLKAMSMEQIKIIQSHVKSSNLILNSSFDLNLGIGSRAKKYAKGIPVYRSYDINSINVSDLLNDFFTLNELLELIITGPGIEEIEQHQLRKLKGDKTPFKRIVTPIDVEKYSELRQIREERNKKIGNAAEKFVFELEKKRLKEIGRFDLSKKVKWLAAERDGYGYDILSFDENGQEKYIEVKGTSLNINNFNFYMSSLEIEASKKHKDKYELVLVKNVLSPNIELSRRIRDPLTCSSLKFETETYKVCYIEDQKNKWDEGEEF